MSPSDGTVQAVETSLDVLHALRRLDGAGVSELARELDVSKGTVHNHLSTLAREDYVVKDAADQYRLGVRFLDLAHHARRRVGTFDTVRREVDALARDTGEMALFTVEEHGLGVCLYRSLGAEAVDTPLYIGHRDTLHHTAVGKAILAHLPRERVERILDERGMEAATPATTTDRAALFEELDAIRERGVAFNREETLQGLAGVGVPVLEQDGTVVGAISVIGPRSRMDDERFHDDLPERISRSVNIVELNATLL